MAFLLIIGVLGVSALLGFGAFVALRRIKRPLLRLALACVPGGVVFVVSGVLFFWLSFTPATDTQVGGTEQLNISVMTSAENMPRSFSDYQNNMLTIGYRSEVKQGEDFTIFVHAPFMKSAVTKDQVFTLDGPPSAKLRTASLYASKKPGGMVDACAPMDISGARVSWDISPLKSGSYVLTLSLPPSALGEKYGEVSWVGYIYDDQQILVRTTRGVQRGDRNSFTMHTSSVPVNSRLEMASAPVQLSAQSPFVYWEGKSVDLGVRQIRLPVTIVTTLGVTERTYQITALLATCISGFLGAGWLWQLLAWRRSSKSVEDPKSQASLE